MNEYIYVIRPTRMGMLTESTLEEDRIVGEHFQYLKRNTEAGIVLLAGRTLTDENEPRGMGIAIFRAEDDAAAQEFANNDPAISGGVFQVEIMPYRVALLSETYPRANLRTDP